MHPHHSIPTIAVTGGIGSGKSTLCELLRSTPNSGCLAVVDLDHCAHSLLNEQSILRELYVILSQPVLDLGLDMQMLLPIVPLKHADENFNDSLTLMRHTLRNWVFEYPNIKLCLEAYLHPKIQTLALTIIDEINDKYKDKQMPGSHAATCAHPYIALAIPLLTHTSNWMPHIDAIVTVETQLQERIARVHARGVPTAVIEQIIQQQPSVLERILLADWVVHNRDLKGLCEQAALLNQLMN